MATAYQFSREQSDMHHPIPKRPYRPANGRERPAPLPNALAYRIDEVPLMGGPSRTKTYALAAEGKLRLIRVAGRTLVDGESLRALLRDGCE
jgi:hypothetical protein